MLIFSNRSVTLIELLVAIALIGLLVIGVFALDNFARSRVFTLDRRTQLQNKAAFAIEQIVKEAVRGIGRINDPAVVVCGADELHIRYDSNKNGQIDDTVTGDSDTADTLVRFYRDNADARTDLRYYPDFGRASTSYEVLTKKVVNHLMLPTPVPIFDCSADDGSINIELILRHDPASDSGVDNPQLGMRARAYPRSISRK